MVAYLPIWHLQISQNHKKGTFLFQTKQLNHVAELSTRVLEYLLTPQNFLCSVRIQEFPSHWNHGKQPATEVKKPP
jgi:hypothetical protein